MTSRLRAPVSFSYPPRRLSPWILTGAVALLVWAGCSSDNQGPTAASSSTVASSAGPSSSSSSGGGGGTSSSASSSTASSGGGGGTGANIGQACASDSDCDDPSLTCLKDSDTVTTFGGGVAGGYCSRDCATDCDCPSTAHCLVQNGSGVCIEACDFGTPASTEDPNKCHGREDVACIPLHSTAGLTGSGCFPECGSDDQCPSGRVCHAATSIKSAFNVCTDQPGSGLPVGSACDLNATTDPCNGTCVQVATGQGICTEPCRYWATLTAQCNDNKG